MLEVGCRLPGLKCILWFRVLRSIALGSSPIRSRSDNLSRGLEVVVKNAAACFPLLIAEMRGATQPQAGGGASRRRRRGSSVERAGEHRFERETSSAVNLQTRFGWA